jgi:hypothetical protein
VSLKCHIRFDPEHNRKIFGESKGFTAGSVDNRTVNTGKVNTGSESSVNVKSVAVSQRGNIQTASVRCRGPAGFFEIPPRNLDGIADLRDHQNKNS